MDVARTLLGPLRIALLTVLLFLFVPLVMAIGRPETGFFEMVVLSAAAMGLLSLASAREHEHGSWSRDAEEERGCGVSASRRRGPGSRRGRRAFGYEPMAWWRAAAFSRVASDASLRAGSAVPPATTASESRILRAADLTLVLVEGGGAGGKATAGFGRPLL